MITKKNEIRLREIIRQELETLNLREIIQQEFEAAMHRTITVEKGPRKQGDFKKVEKEEEWNILDWLIVYFPYIEGALRGVQEDIDKTKNALLINSTGLKAVADTLIGMEAAAKKLASLSDFLALEEKKTPKMIDLSDESPDR